MKKIILISLSIATLSLAAIQPVKAETKLEHLDLIGMNLDKAPVSEIITPFDLVSRAYGGAYIGQGISSFGAFDSDAAAQRITATTLVRAAIAAKQLPTKIQADSTYLNAVTTFLRNSGV
jgi:hypothetical protein